jgi:hypothetical protein
MYSIKLLTQEEASKINSISENSTFQLTVITLLLVGPHSVYRIQNDSAGEEINH